MSDPDVMARLAEMENQIQELKAVQDLLLRLASTTRPLSGLLEYYGANETNEQALYKFLDELVELTRAPKHRHPTFSVFRIRLGELFPELRGDRQFVQLIIDTLRVERPAYRELYKYMTSHGWPVWE